MNTVSRLKGALTAAAFGAGILAAGPGAQAEDLKFLTSWNENYQGTVGMALEYKKLVEEASGGSVQMPISGPDVIPPFEQLQPVQAGVFDVLYTHGAYHAGTTTMLIGMDTVDPDPASRRDAGLWDAIDAHYQTLGMKVLALPTSGGVHTICRDNLPASGDFQGFKVRGTPPVHPMIEAMGGTPVVLPPAEIYSSLEKGVIDCATWPMLGAVGFKWFEVTKTFVRPATGSVTHLIAMNLDKWNSLSPDTQTLLLEQGKVLEERVRAIFTDWENEEEARLLKEGMTETQLDDANAAKLVQAHADGYWTIAGKRDTDKASALREMAKQANLIGQ